MAEKEIDFKAIEKKWQQEWEKSKVFQVKEDKTKKKFYCLEMFPYPSGEGLHMGHAFNYTIGDVFARFKRMQGFNVLYPTGYDSLGLPAENAAIKAGVHPKTYTEKAIINFIKQQKTLGFSYDWGRVVKTSDPDYYRWDQWIFLKMFEKGLAFRKKAPVNWCPKCNTALANEQVHNGKCWRHEDTNVEIKPLEQWFFKITDYAEEIYEDIKKLKGWPENIKAMQENWIGKSHGININFIINKKPWPIFTTRPDTIYGVTFMVIAAQHPELMKLVTKEQKSKIEAFLKKIKSTSEKDMEELEKEGVFTGSYAINPVNNEKIPVYTGNFVLAEYGSGMVMAVPAHDQRDFEFAKRYNLLLKEVIRPIYGEKQKNEEFRKTISAVVHRKRDNKFLILKWKNNEWVSPVVGGIDEGEKLEKASEREVLEETGYRVKFVKKLGGEFEAHYLAPHKKVFRYRIDQPVLMELIDEKPKKIEEREKNLHEAIWLTADEALKQITHEYNKLGLLRYLGKDMAFIGEGILINSGKFNGLTSKDAIKVISDYIEKQKFGKRTVNFKLRDWLISRQRYWGTPIPIVYCDKCGIVPVPESALPIELPNKVTFGKGNPLATNKEFIEVKCPKCKGKARRETDTMDTFVNSSWYFLRYCDSKNNKEIFDKKKAAYWMPIDQYIGGAEHACMHLIYFRFYTKFLRDLGLIAIDEPALKLFNQGMVHGTDGTVMAKSRGNVVNPLEIIEKYNADTLRLYLISTASPDKDFTWDERAIEGSYRFIRKVYDYFLKVKKSKPTPKTESKLNKTIKEFTDDIENFRYNLAIIKLRELFDYLSEEESKETLESFLKFLSLFCPHVSEELWHKLGNKSFISTAIWPQADEKKIKPEFEQQDKAVEQLKQDISHVLKIINKKPKAIYIYVIPKETSLYNSKELEQAFSCKVQIMANNKATYDPQKKASKAKPGKPALYIE